MYFISCTTFSILKSILYFLLTVNANNAQWNSAVTFVLLQLLHIYKWTAKLQFENYNNFELESFDKTQLNKLHKINSLRREKESLLWKFLCEYQHTEQIFPCFCKQKTKQNSNMDRFEQKRTNCFKKNTGEPIKCNRSYNHCII